MKIALKFKPLSKLLLYLLMGDLMLWDGLIKVCNDAPVALSAASDV